MRYYIPIFLLTLIGCAEEKKQSFQYPETRKDTTVVDDYFGIAVADPYRWLEDDNSDETADWVTRQNDLTFSYLNSLPNRDKIKTRLEKLFDYERYGTPFKKGGKFFFYKNDGMQDQSVLYMQQSLDEDPVVLIDPNTLSEDGTVALGSVSVSKNGNYMAYQLSASGSDWNQIHIRNLKTGEDLTEVLEWVKFSGVSWKGDGFFYSRYDAPDEGAAYSGKNEFHKVYFHTLGTDQTQDELIYWNADEPLRNYYAWTPEAEDAVVVYESESTSGSALYYKADGDEGFRQIAEGFDHEYSLLNHVDGKLLCKTNNGASNYRVVLLDAGQPKAGNWQEVIPEKEQVLTGVQIAGGKLVATYLKDVCTEINIHEMDGSYIRTLELPTKGDASFNGDKDDDLAFYSFRSFTYPNTIFKYDISNGTSEVYKKPLLDF
ncbi:MAG: S9 family peptidase, partial [Flavobacteriales bacterium]|nr:S9 family peptidase [Flavobacteriales bacterium]